MSKPKKNKQQKIRPYKLWGQRQRTQHLSALGKEFLEILEDLNDYAESSKNPAAIKERVRQFKKKLDAAVKDTRSGTREEF